MLRNATNVAKILDLYVGAITVENAEIFSEASAEPNTTSAQASKTKECVFEKCASSTNTEEKKRKPSSKGQVYSLENSSNCPYLSTLI